MTLPPGSSDTPPSKLPVSTRLTTSQTEPATMPAAPYSAITAQRRSG